MHTTNQPSFGQNVKCATPVLSMRNFQVMAGLELNIERKKQLILTQCPKIPIVIFSFPQLASSSTLFSTVD